tara:strand:+ start:115 stop:936 length:822 start_codon:yes stop_codon:yes gene_type:complete
MAITETRVRPPEFIEAAGKTYLEDLSKAVGGFKEADLSQTFGPQFVAGPGALQTQAESLAGGLGSFQPFLTTAAATTGPQAYQQFMSPFQQDVIDTTLSEFDRQAAMGRQRIADQAIASGAFGGGREGVQLAEYGAASDRNRAALQAQLLSQGFGQAQQAAQQAFAQQTNLAQLAPQLAGQQIAGLSTLGAQQQAQEQAQLTAQQQLAQQQLQQPLTAAQQYGSGVTSLIAGYPGSTQQTSQPGPSPVSTALGIGSTLAGIYRAFQPQQLKIV